jgi:hypothetical protein
MEFTPRMRSMYNADLTPEYQRSPVKELRGDKGLNYTARHSHLNKRDTAPVFCIFVRLQRKFTLAMSRNFLSLPALDIIAKGEIGAGQAMGFGLMEWRK